MVRDDELPYACEALNRANAYAAELEPKLRDIFGPLVGVKILKADGSLMEKYAKLLPESPNTPALHVYRLASRYSLAWTVRTSVFIPPHGCTYQETTIYVGILAGNVLESLYQPDPARRVNYTADDIREKRRIAKEAKRVYEAARSACEPFGE